MIKPLVAYALMAIVCIWTASAAVCVPPNLVEQTLSDFKRQYNDPLLELAIDDLPTAHKQALANSYANSNLVGSAKGSTSRAIADAAVVAKPEIRLLLQEKYAELEGWGGSEPLTITLKTTAVEPTFTSVSKVQTDATARQTIGEAAARAIDEANLGKQAAEFDIRSGQPDQVRNLYSTLTEKVQSGQLGMEDSIIVKTTSGSGEVIKTEIGVYKTREIINSRDLALQGRLPEPNMLSFVQKYDLKGVHSVENLRSGPELSAKGVDSSIQDKLASDAMSRIDGTERFSGSLSGVKEFLRRNTVEVTREEITSPVQSLERIGVLNAQEAAALEAAKAGKGVEWQNDLTINAIENARLRAMGSSVDPVELSKPASDFLIKKIEQWAQSQPDPASRDPSIAMQNLQIQIALVKEIASPGGKALTDLGESAAVDRTLFKEISSAIARSTAKNLIGEEAYGLLKTQNNGKEPHIIDARPDTIQAQIDALRSKNPLPDDLVIVKNADKGRFQIDVLKYSDLIAAGTDAGTSLMASNPGSLAHIEQIFDPRANTVITSSRFSDAMKTNGLQNLALTKAEEITSMLAPYTTMTRAATAGEIRDFTARHKDTIDWSSLKVEITPDALSSIGIIDAAKAEAYKGLTEGEQTRRMTSEIASQAKQSGETPVDYLFSMLDKKFAGDRAQSEEFYNKNIKTQLSAKVYTDSRPGGDLRLYDSVSDIAAKITDPRVAEDLNGFRSVNQIIDSKSADEAFNRAFFEGLAQMTKKQAGETRCG